MDFEKLVDTTKTVPGPHGRPAHPALRKHPVNFKSRRNEGRARVSHGYLGETGPWVVITDVKTEREYRIRPSQVWA
jgi:hypothetical protein